MASTLRVGHRSIQDADNRRSGCRMLVEHNQNLRGAKHDLHEASAKVKAGEDLVKKYEDILVLTIAERTADLNLLNFLVAIYSDDMEAVFSTVATDSEADEACEAYATARMAIDECYYQRGVLQSEIHDAVTNLHTAEVALSTALECAEDIKCRLDEVRQNRHEFLLGEFVGITFGDIHKVNVYDDRHDNTHIRLIATGGRMIIEPDGNLIGTRLFFKQLHFGQR